MSDLQRVPVLLSNTSLIYQTDTTGRGCSFFQANDLSIYPSSIHWIYLCRTDLGEEAAVVPSQNHLHDVFEPLQTQHVRCQHHLAVGRETPRCRSVCFQGLHSHPGHCVHSHTHRQTQYLALAPAGRSTMAPYMYCSRISISSGPKLKR